MQPRRTSWTAVTALLAAGVVGAGAVGKLPGALPVLREDFGLSLVAAGWVVSMFNMLALASAVFFGFVADRTGALRACLLGLGALAIGATLGATTHSTITLLVSRFIEGGGFIALAVSVPALIATPAVGRTNAIAAIATLGARRTVNARAPVRREGTRLWIIRASGNGGGERGVGRRAVASRAVQGR